jgi:hypothetical protein
MGFTESDGYNRFQLMSDITEKRKLAAIMFTDMVGYSALSQRNDKLARELLSIQRPTANV